MMIAVGRYANVNSAVSLRRDLIVESQVEVAEFLSGPQPRTGGSRAFEPPVAHLPALFSRFTTAFPARQVLPVEETAKTDFRHLQRAKLELPSLGNLALQTNVAVRVLESTHLVRLFPVDREGDGLADDGNVEYVPLSRLHESRAGRTRKISNVAFFALQEIDLVPGFWKRLPFR